MARAGIEPGDTMIFREAAVSDSTSEDPAKST
jgi:hypothetical protein